MNDTTSVHNDTQKATNELLMYKMQHIEMSIMLK